MGALTIDEAVRTGMVWVYGCVFVGFAIPLVGIGALDSIGFYDRASGEAGLAAVLGLLATAFFTSWIAWSWQVPKWRLWAYRRVDDIEALKLAAVGVGLIWPEGHIFERTELRSEEQVQELRRLERESRTRRR